MPPPPSLLDEIRSGTRSLKKSVDDGEKNAVPSATMIRGGLINEIHRGKTLRKVEQPAQPAQSSSLARAGFLHELRSKRPPLPAVGESGHMASRRGSTPATSHSHRGSATPATAADASAASAASAARAVVIKEGWLHKRQAHSSIWQRRWFRLSAASLQYSHRAAAAGGALDDAEGMLISEIHDVHPTGHGGEFCLFHKERRLRLR